MVRQTMLRRFKGQSLKNGANPGRRKKEGAGVASDTLRKRSHARSADKSSFSNGNR